MNDRKLAYMYLASGIFWIAVLATTIAVSGCAVRDAQQPEPMEPEIEPAGPAEPQEPEESPDAVFDREVDACFVTYRECQRSGKPESVCFPPHEACVVAAYRKLKKARGQ